MSLHIFHLLLLLFCVQFTTTLKCHHSLKNGQFDRKFSTCNGDNCYLYKDEKSGVTIQGCISGVISLDHPDFRSSDIEWVWVCDSDFCNEQRPKYYQQFFANTSTVEKYTCLNGNKNETCLASKCWYQYEKFQVQPGEIAEEERRFCWNFPGNPSYLLVLGPLTQLLMPEACYVLINDYQDGHTLSQMVCSCSNHSCNRKEWWSQLKDGDTRKSVSCTMSLQNIDHTKHIEHRCQGHYCYVERTKMNGDEAVPFQVYSKGCLNVTGSRSYLHTGYRRFDKGTMTEEAWICDQNDCNADLEKAEMNAIRSTTILMSTSTVANDAHSMRTIVPPTTVLEEANKTTVVTPTKSVKAVCTIRETKIVVLLLVILAVFQD